MIRSSRLFSYLLGAAAALAVGWFALSSQAAPAGPGAHATGAFKGAKVNGGTVTHETKDGKSMLTLSEDFKAPDTPDPHWQVVDSDGRAYLLNRLKIKGGLTGDKFSRTITVPAHVPNVAKVQIYCAWAEVVLGEASFETPVK